MGNRVLVANYIHDSTRFLPTLINCPPHRHRRHIAVSALLASPAVIFSRLSRPYCRHCPQEWYLWSMHRCSAAALQANTTCKAPHHKSRHTHTRARARTSARLRRFIYGQGSKFPQSGTTHHTAGTWTSPPSRQVTQSPRTALAQTCWHHLQTLSSRPQTLANRRRRWFHRFGPSAPNPSPRFCRALW